jgi:hypothetical protein
VSEAEKKTIDLTGRLALRIPEAASALGLSEGCFRKVLPEIEKVHVGTAVVIPVKALERWLTDTAKAEKTADEALVQELLDGVR